MFKVLGILIIGMLLGRLFRKIKSAELVVNKLIMVTIFLLLFLLGVAIGTNEMILKNLPTLGLNALLLTLGGITGSLLLANIVYVKFFKETENDER